MSEIIIIILALAIAVFSAIKPYQVGKFKIDIITGSLIALTITVVSGAISLFNISHGLLGYSSLKPWEILLIFYSVAYVSISVDLSGILDYFAFRIVHLAKGKGLLLFVFFYIFASLLTVFTSNDIVILTLTPIIFYLRKHAKINIIPLLFAEFYGANTLSMLLYIGNPTNIIVGNAVGLSFSGYFHTMLYPTLVATVLNFILLFLFFRRRITKNYQISKNSTIKLRSLYDVLGSSFLLFCMLISLIFSERLGWEIWQITIFYALLMIIEDMLIGIIYITKNRQLYTNELSKGLKENFTRFGSLCNRTDLFVVFKRLPWKILPFLVVVFIFIAGLVDLGLINNIAIYISSLSSSLFQNILIFGWSSLLITNIINNQPMAILFSNILINQHNNLSLLNQQGATYAVIIASNLGANLTIIGALAGLMWSKILQTKNVKVSYKLFLKIGLSITPLVFLVTLLTLWIVLS